MFRFSASPSQTRKAQVLCPFGQSQHITFSETTIHRENSRNQILMLIWKSWSDFITHEKWHPEPFPVPIWLNFTPWTSTNARKRLNWYDVWTDNAVTHWNNPSNEKYISSPTSQTQLHPRTTFSLYKLNLFLHQFSTINRGIVVIVQSYDCRKLK